jgi:hypothetical protein
VIDRAPTTGIGRWQTPALIAGILGLAGTAIGFVIDKETFFRAYLPSWIFWFQIVAGSLGVLMLQYVTGGEWGLLIRRPLGAAARTMWVMLVLFLPIALGLHYLYPWMDAAYVHHHESVRVKAAYLNGQWFYIRTAVYFFLWIAWAWGIRRLSLRFYDDRSPDTDLKRRKLASAGLPMFVLTLTFCSIDWVMSLEPTWFSTMFGINFLIAACLAAYAFVIFFLTRLVHTQAMADILKPSHLRDLGNLMLAFVMLYAYTLFSEYLLTWYANLKEEIPHYLVRQSGAWGAVALLIVVFHFFLPFFMLLMRAIKDRPQTIAVVAVIVLVIRYVGTYWLVAPSYYRELHYSWMSLTSLVGIGGVWLFFFLGQLKGQTIIPIHETWVEEAIREGALKVHA